MKKKPTSVSTGLQKRVKRSIHVKGKWKAVALDPSLFSEEGLEGLVCFEEVTNYCLVDSKKAAAEAEKQLKKKEKKKAKKRKVGVEDEAGEKVASESEDGEVTTEPANKKAKKKKNKKLKAKESIQSDTVIQEDAAACEEAGEDVSAKGCIKATSSDPDDQTKPAKKSNKKKKRGQKQQGEKDTASEEQSKLESKSEPQTLDEETSTKDKVTKPSKQQQNNWTYASLSSCKDRNADVSAWKDLFVPSPVLKALSSLGFGSPTPIQALTLPSAIRDHMDILGAAETGKIQCLVTYVP